MDQNQKQYHGPERRQSQAKYHGTERRRLDWPFKPLSPAQRDESMAPTTTPGQADEKP
jgi:hypothetical protein